MDSGIQSNAYINCGICPKCGLRIGGSGAFVAHYVNGRYYHPDCVPKPRPTKGEPHA